MKLYIEVFPGLSPPLRFNVSDASSLHSYEADACIFCASLSCMSCIISILFISVVFGDAWRDALLASLPFLPSDTINYEVSCFNKNWKLFPA